MATIFGLTEITAVSQQPQIIEAIIPTIAIPFLLASTIASSIVTGIAALFGITLHLEGPRTLLKFFLKPRVLVGIVILNTFILGGVYGYRWLDNRSRPLWWIHFKNTPVSSNLVYTNFSPDDWTNQPDIGPTISTPQSSSRSSSKSPRLQVEWAKKLPSGAFRGLSFSGPSAFAASLDGFVYELDRATGDLRRKFFVGHPSIPLPVIHDGVLFAGEGEHETHHARIYAFDLQSGKLKGHVQTNGHTEGDITIEVINGKTILFIPTGNDGLYAVDSQTQKILWQTPLAHFDSGVTVADGTVFAATGLEKGVDQVSPTLFALNASDGSVLWKTELATSGWSRAVIFKDWVCVGVGDIYSNRQYGQFACYDQKTGQPRLALNHSAPFFGRPLQSVARDGSVILIDFSGRVCRIDLDLQRFAWCRSTSANGPVFNTVSQDRAGRIYVPTSEGVEVLDLNDGHVIAAWKPTAIEEKWQNTFAGIAVENDGVFVIDEFGVLRKLKWTSALSESI